MPRDTSDIGSHGLEQGGANLGNDITRRISTDRNEQNTTTNVGSGSTENAGNENATSNANTAEDSDSGDGSMPDPETLSKEESE
ncbi:MAG TPA: hypothetical protein VF622_05645 [Segetibacter sp.]|jgi:hypothetical protein